MENKQGVELAITTILLIILGVAVATILIVILNSQTSVFSDFIDSFRGKSNVDEVVVGCNSLASTESYYEYCCEKKEVIWDESITILWAKWAPSDYLIV